MTPHDDRSVSNRAPDPKGDSLKKVAEEVRGCTLCPLSRTRTRAVPGEGNPRAELVLIGEGPGYNEDKQRLPFVGAAGSFLNELLSSARLRREDVFVTNIVKCRPPQNRDPLPNEIEACSGYLRRQLELIQPKVVATLGRHSMNRYFPNERIMQVHGQPRRVGGLTVVPLLHPAAALHKPPLRATELEDFARLPEILAQAGEPALPERGRAPEAAQAQEQGPAAQRAGDDTEQIDMTKEERLDQLKLF